MPVVAHVSTSVFDGPCDLLLQLVTEHKLDIYEIPLAEVVDAFLTDLAAREGLDLGETTQFLVVAAILVELKSRALLPGSEVLDEDEEISGFDERDRLLARLLELQAYAAASDAFAMLIEQAARSVPRVAGLDERFRDMAPDLLAGITVERLAAAFRRASAPRPALVLDLSHVTVEAVTVSEAVEELETRLPGAGTVGFRTLTAHCTTRMQVIVRFLALLELCKRGWIALEQGETFGDLAVTWIVSAPALSTVGARHPVEEYDG